MAITLDTLKFLDDLEKAQVPHEQARAIVQVVRESHESADVATKGDLALVHRELDAKIDLVRSDLRSEIVLLRWMLGVTLAGVGAIFAKLFF